MNTKLKLKYKERLLELRAALNGDIDHLENSALNTPEHTYGIDKIGELGSDNFEQEMSLVKMDCEQETLEMVESALERLETSNGKEYGLCKNCKKGISENRLNAIPYAVLCINCQREEEAE